MHIHSPKHQAIKYIFDVTQVYVPCNDLRVETELYTIQYNIDVLTEVPSLGSRSSFHLKKMIHPKICKFNLHNITHSLISQNPRKWMFLVQIPLLIVTFLFFTSQILSLMQATCLFVSFIYSFMAAKDVILTFSV